MRANIKFPLALRSAQLTLCMLSLGTYSITRHTAGAKRWELSSCPNSLNTGAYQINNALRRHHPWGKVSTHKHKWTGELERWGDWVGVGGRGASLPCQVKLPCREAIAQMERAHIWKLSAQRAAKLSMYAQGREMPRPWLIYGRHWVLATCRHESRRDLGTST